MSVYSRVVLRMIVLCALIAGTIVLVTPVKAEAFACPGGIQCSVQYHSCLVACGTNTACRKQCQIDLGDCCSL